MFFRHALATSFLAFALASCGTPTITSSPDKQGETAQSEPSAESSTKKPKAAGVGDAITLQGADESLKITVKLARVIRSGTPANEIAKPEGGKRLYGVELVMKNAGKTPYDDSPSNGAKIVDSEGQEYEASLFGDIAGTHKLDSVTFGPGDVRKGVLVFEVPQNAKVTKFLFALNSGFADQKGEWSTK